MTINPSQAAGLDACTETHIGYVGQVAGTPRFNKTAQSCPQAAKLGTAEVTSPALVARNEAHEVEEKEGKPVLQILHGSLYLAKPFANPLGKLIAVYLVVEDEKTGIVAKLAGEGELDPQTGQVTTRFRENPELPFEDVRVHIPGGPRGAFTTPPTCGVYVTNAVLTPWSAPEAPVLERSGPFTTVDAPGGGTCPSTEAQLSNSPGFAAGTESPAAGKYSQLLFELSREDGTQRFSRFETTLPSGVSAKLAGVATCSEAGIAKARSRELPERGAAEQADPSCPAASLIGIANAGAGAGPSPYYAHGNAYLAGPYKGAPLSLVVITPAVAGPYDLGTIVVRAALRLDPSSGQITAESDPIPSILQGIPLDVRSIDVQIDRPSFTLTGTSCDPSAVTGSALSTLGQIAPLLSRYQLGECTGLAFKPKLAIRLFGSVKRAGNPALKATLTMPAGGANIAQAAVSLPHSEFLDQSHIGTVCTRVQFAEGDGNGSKCPPASIYGAATATSPLVDYTLEGNAYLRSSSHELPDLVVALHGPAYQPIAIDAVGRIDSVKGGIRTTFEGVPDLPISTFTLNMQGGKKGLLQNSTNICKATGRATALLAGQNGKVHDTRPLVEAQCGKGAEKSSQISR